MVLVGALIGINVFLVLISGTVISLIVGVATGSLAVGDMFAAVGEGVTGMYDITVISIVVACIVSLVKEFGGIQFILNLIKKSIKGQKAERSELPVCLCLWICVQRIIRWQLLWQDRSLRKSVKNLTFLQEDLLPCLTFLRR